MCLHRRLHKDEFERMRPISVECRLPQMLDIYDEFTNKVNFLHNSQTLCTETKQYHSKRKSYAQLKFSLFTYLKAAQPQLMLVLNLFNANLNEQQLRLLICHDMNL